MPKFKDGRRMPGAMRLPFISPELAERIKLYAARHRMTITDICYLAITDLLNRDEAEIVVNGEMVAESETH